MDDVFFKIDGEDARPFMEYRALQIELAFKGDSVVNVLGGSEVIRGGLTDAQFTFVHENADKLNARLLPGSLGVFWGVPIEILKRDLKVFDGYISLANGATFSCDKVTATLMERKQIDWLDKNADGVTFKFMEGIGQITAADYMRVPYIVSEIPNYRDALILSISTFAIGIELQRTVKDIVNVTSDLAGVFTTISGVLKLLYLLVYLGLLILALTKLIKELVRLFVQPIKYHYAMSLQKHFEKACAYFGFTFSSSLFLENVPSNIVDIDGNAIASGYWKDLYWMPKKSKVGAERGRTPKEKGIFDGTVGDFFREMVKIFNGKITIDGNVLHFEREDRFDVTTAYQIPDVKRDSHGINSDEVKGCTLYEFKLDSMDYNTTTRIEGNNVMNTLTPIDLGADGTLDLGGLLEISPICALGRRKDELTEIELGLLALFRVIQPILNTIYNGIDTINRTVTKIVKSMNKLIKAVNTLPGVKLKKLNTPSINYNRLDLVQSITDRVGMLALSGDITGVPKLLMLNSDGRMPANAHVILSAENIWRKYYYIKSFAPSIGKPNARQYYIWEVKNVPFCYEDYFLIRNECKVTSPEGNEARIRSVLWNIWNNTADIIYWENKTYDTNLKESITKDTGE